jgi:hypothetical protein
VAICRYSGTVKRIEERRGVFTAGAEIAVRGVSIDAGADRAKRIEVSVDTGADIAEGIKVCTDAGADKAERSRVSKYTGADIAVKGVTIVTAATERASKEKFDVGDDVDFCDGDIWFCGCATEIERRNGRTNVKVRPNKKTMKEKWWLRDSIAIMC